MYNKRRGLYQATGAKFDYCRISGSRPEICRYNTLPIDTSIVKPKPNYNSFVFINESGNAHRRCND
jgi:hypothetical protein